MAYKRRLNDSRKYTPDPYGRMPKTPGPKPKAPAKPKTREEYLAKQGLEVDREIVVDTTASNNTTMNRVPLEQVAIVLSSLAEDERNNAVLKAPNTNDRHRTNFSYSWVVLVYKPSPDAEERYQKYLKGYQSRLRSYERDMAEWNEDLKVYNKRLKVWKDYRKGQLEKELAEYA